MDRVRTYLSLAVLLVLPSGYGLYRLVFFSLPNLRERFFFLFLTAIFVTGISLPVFAALNKYFFAAKQIIPQTVVRESIVSAILVNVLIWFKIGRVLNSTIIFLTVGGFLIVEILLRAQETVQYRPEFDNLKKENKD